MHVAGQTSTTPSAGKAVMKTAVRKLDYENVINVPNNINRIQIKLRNDRTANNTQCLVRHKIKYTEFIRLKPPPCKDITTADKKKLIKNKRKLAAINLTPP